MKDFDRYRITRKRFFVRLSIKRDCYYACTSFFFFLKFEYSPLELMNKNFKPVSNLPMVSKLAEEAVVGQLFQHCSDNAPLPVHRSSYRQFDSTESDIPSN